ncbi:MAG: hypothetical protein ACRBFS_08025 [Aureispira sp.]
MPNYLIADKYEITIKADEVNLALIGLVILCLLAFWKFVPKR